MDGLTGLEEPRGRAIAPWDDPAGWNGHILDYAAEPGAPSLRQHKFNAVRWHYRGRAGPAASGGGMAWAIDLELGVQQ